MYFGDMLKKPEVQQQELEMVSVGVAGSIEGTCCGRWMGRWISVLSGIG